MYVPFSVVNFNSSKEYMDHKIFFERFLSIFLDKGGSIMSTAGCSSTHKSWNTSPHSHLSHYQLHPRIIIGLLWVSACPFESNSLTSDEYLHSLPGLKCYCVNIITVLKPQVLVSYTYVHKLCTGTILRLVEHYFQGYQPGSFVPFPSGFKE